MALFVDLAALSNGLHGSVQMDSGALFLWIGWLRHHGILISFTFKNFLSVSHFNLVSLKINAKLKYKMIELKEAGHPTFIKKSFYLYFSKKILCFSCYLQPPDRMHLFELKKESYNVNIIVYYIYANTLFIYN